MDELAARGIAGRRPGDIVVVSLHWGTNWGEQIPDEQVRFAHRLVDAGVDVVHGHSSHHPRAAERVGGGLVLLGLRILATALELFSALRKAWRDKCERDGPGSSNT